MNVAVTDRIKEYLESGRRARLRHDRKAALAAFEAAATIDPLNAGIKIEVAKELRALDRLDESSVMLDDILGTQPHHAGALIERGHVRRRQGKHEEAAAAFRAAAGADPRNLNIQVELARDLRALGRFDEADAVLGKVLAVEPQQVGALVERGHIRRRQGRHEEAAAAFKAAAAADSNSNRNIQVELARDLRTLGRFDEADAALGTVLDAEPQHVGALVERGHVRRQQGRHEESAAAFKAAAAADPNNLNIQVELARNLRVLGRLDEADQVLGGVLDVDPRQFGALVERGHIRRARADYAGALSAFEAAAAVDPRNSGLQLEIVGALRALGRLGEAESVLRKLIETDPTNLAAVIRLVHLMLDTNQLDEADALLKRAMTTSPNDFRLIGALGHLARRRGDGAEALRYFKCATEANPANLDIKLDLAAELREQGHFDDALALLRSVLAADADHWAAWMQLGQYYRAKDEPRSAIEAFRTAVIKQPGQTQGLVDLAQETWAVGNPKEAEQLLRRAFEQDPNHLGAILISAEQALQTEKPDRAYQLAVRAVQLHPGQLGPYLIAARAAAYNLNRKAALDLLNRAHGIFGALPDIAATQIHVLRHFREHSAIRSLIANTGEQANAGFPFWVESTSFAITTGDFERAERALNATPAKSSREFARVHFLRAHLAEARRQYEQAIAGYQAALSFDPRNGGWHSEMARACLLLLDIDGTRAHLKSAFTIDSATKIVAGQSLNISQHHTGQLLDEFVMDQALLGRLIEACALPMEKRIDALKQLVRDNPDHTAPALLLLLTLRQSGLLSIDKIPPSTAPSAIPSRIIQFWNTEVPPPDVGELVGPWREVHSDYEYRIFNDESADKYLTEHYPPDVATAFRRSQLPAQRADIFRLAILALEGGFYIDIDDRCLVRLDTFTPRAAQMICYQENYGTIANNFIGAIPRHPVIARALKLAVEATNRGDRDMVWLSTGPGLLTRSYAQIAAEAAAAECLARSAVLELWEAQRVIGLHCPLAYKSTEEHWSRAVFRRRPQNRAASAAAVSQ